MAITTTVLTKAVTLGATVLTLTKSFTGVFSGFVGTDLGVLSMKAADPMAKKRYISVTLKCDPSLADSPSVATSGKVSINVNCSYTPGTDVTDAYVKTRLLDVASIISQDAIITALIAGSYE